MGAFIASALPAAELSDRPAGAAIARLRLSLAQLNGVAVAVSGGIDSMVMAVIAGRLLGADARMMHAVSPAVPRRATQRVECYAERENWQLQMCDAGEFGDRNYRQNPINRCFYCKTNLYQHIAEKCPDSTIVSGTNCDDLRDFRPGLNAAKQFGVQHPYVDAGIAKEGIRSIARELGLDDLSALPASPCLSSRVETGIPISRRALRAVDQTEVEIGLLIRANTVRCRIRHDCIGVELDASAFAALGNRERRAIEAIVSRNFAFRGTRPPIVFSTYAMGSAFVADSS